MAGRSERRRLVELAALGRPALLADPLDLGSGSAQRGADLVSLDLDDAAPLALRVHPDPLGGRPGSAAEGTALAWLAALDQIRAELERDD